MNQFAPASKVRGLRFIWELAGRLTTTGNGTGTGIGTKARGSAAGNAAVL